MLAVAKSSTLAGIDGLIVTVEVDISGGLPSFDIVGLPDSAIKESRERVKTAITNSSYSFPLKKITVNLAPGDVRKEGPSFDLPIAIGILKSIGVVKNSSLQDYFMLGELSLDGDVKGVKGVLPMVHCAFSNELKTCIVPMENVKEASVIEGVNVIGVNSIKEVVEYLNGTLHIAPHKTDIESFFTEEDFDAVDFSEIKGQEPVRRAIEVATSGYHNILIIGPPGSGKTMMAKRIPTIMPSLKFNESIEVTKIYSVANMLEKGMGLIVKRPFRSPHHTISYGALVGGGKMPMPGEISLSHYGILFLDEMPEFSRKVLENLRQPMEDKRVTISRVSKTITYPSNFMMVASMNPCPCGYYGHSDRCQCTQGEISKYLNKISGPLLDRIDIQIEAPAITYGDLSGKAESESSKEIKKRVVYALNIQRERYEKEAISYNSELTPSHIAKYCIMTKEGEELLKMAYEKFGFSARVYHKILKVARTIADLAESKEIEKYHIAEAITYRNMDRSYWK